MSPEAADVITCRCSVRIRRLAEPCVVGGANSYNKCTHDYYVLAPRLCRNTASLSGLFVETGQVQPAPRPLANSRPPLNLQTEFLVAFLTIVARFPPRLMAWRAQRDAHLSQGTLRGQAWCAGAFWPTMYCIYFSRRASIIVPVLLNRGMHVA